jgi:N-acetylglucosaminyldiphosphoundecaprenol N-acetyl-beta-D-mannosaminyltransferase
MSSSPSETSRILDVQVHRVTLPGTLEWLERFVEQGRPHQIVTVNMDFIRLARKDQEFREVVNRAALAVADGVPVLWCSRLLGQPLPERVTGVDIVEHGAALAAERGYGVFLLGAAAGVAEGAAQVLRRRHPALRIVGTYSPPFGPFTDEEDAHMVRLVRSAQPQMLFVAFGAPKQDHWIDRHLDELGVPICVGVGGTLDLLAGRLPRAPRWMQSAGLEWVFRLMQEPQRLWRRYLINDLPLFLRIAGSRLFARSGRA